MIIDCISDLHGFLPDLRGGDLLIIAGDFTARDNVKEWVKVFDYMKNLSYEKVIFIGGNHDGFLQNNPEMCFESLYEDWQNYEYLQDSGTTYQGLKIWGSPWTPTFFNWHFMKDRGEEIKKMWDLIPEDTDILITHGPPMGIQDEVKCSSKGNGGNYAGCEELRNTIDNRLKNLKLHVFGHVHEGYGKVVCEGKTFVNASIMNENYDPVNKPIRIIL